jgi:hypothetical protein
MVLALAESDGPVDIFFRRPGELDVANPAPGAAFVTFFSPRTPIPQKLAPNHYRFAIQGGSVYRSMVALLELLQEEFEGREVRNHFGWPTSSWLDRMAVGVFVANLMRLPKMFPRLAFAIEAPVQATPRAAGAASQERATGA